jgi:hypothetical protein
MKSAFALWFGGLMLLGIAPVLAKEPIGIEALYRLDRLPAFRSSVTVGSVSSYDRTGGNDDGFSGKYSFVRKDPEGLVLADLKGPGVIYRVWTPTPSDDVLEFLFDGEAQPRIEVKFRDFFLGKDADFPAPLTGFGGGGYYSYVPIPFAKSCVVRMRAPKVQFYQINYATYPPETQIESFTRAQTAGYRQSIQRAQELFQSAGKDITSFACPPGSKIDRTESRVTLKPQTAATVFKTEQGGRLLGLVLSPTEALTGKSRDLLLKISFDGESASVFCPLGDFFGYAWGKPATRSLLLGTSGNANYCYFPMPFERSATVEIASERNDPVELKAEVIHCAAPRTKDEGKFYALWRRENPTTVGRPYTFLNTTGRGHLVGLVLQAQGLESGKTLFFEGDDQTTIDGKLTIHGTGSEDFFNGGWYDVPDRWEKRISFPLSGCLGYFKHLGRTGAYRLFLGDAYAYRQSLLQTIEHSGERNDIPADYCSVTYFYSEQRPTVNLEPPPLAGRKVNDPRELIFPTSWQTPIYAWSFDRATLTRKKEKVEGEEIRYLSMRASGEDWFGSHFISFTCDIPEAGKHSIYIEAMKGPEQAMVQLFSNENPVAPPVDVYSEKPAKSGRLLLGSLALEEGRNNLMIKLVGKNEKSSGLGLDILQLICVREP